MCVDSTLFRARRCCFGFISTAGTSLCMCIHAYDPS
jgi:hypothetical protein